MRNFFLIVSLWGNSFRSWSTQKSHVSFYIFAPATRNLEHMSFLMSRRPWPVFPRHFRHVTIFTVYPKQNIILANAFCDYLQWRFKFLKIINELMKILYYRMQLFNLSIYLWKYQLVSRATIKHIDQVALHAWKLNLLIFQCSHGLSRLTRHCPTIVLLSTIGARGARVCQRLLSSWVVCAYTQWLRSAIVRLGWDVWTIAAVDPSDRLRLDLTPLSGYGFWLLPPSPRELANDEGG